MNCARNYKNLLNSVKVMLKIVAVPFLRTWSSFRVVLTTMSSWLIYHYELNDQQQYNIQRGTKLTFIWTFCSVALYRISVSIVVVFNYMKNYSFIHLLAAVHVIPTPALILHSFFSLAALLYAFRGKISWYIAHIYHSFMAWHMGLRDIDTATMGCAAVPQSNVKRQRPKLNDVHSIFTL